VNSRSAARELTLIAFSHLSKKSENLENINIQDIVLSAVRTLVNDAENDLKNTVGALVEAKDYIDSYETEHPDNLERPLGVSNLPVPVPMTSDMSGRINTLVNVAEKAFQALEIAEMSALENTQEVKEYISLITEAYRANSDEINGMISEFSKGWDIERLVKIDKNILRIAVTELMYLKDTPVSVAIDEAVELAKKYSTDESSAFINGILGQIVKNKYIQK
jgi:N utilization substance protein B